MLGTYKNVSEAKIELIQRGYSKRFTFDKESLSCQATGSVYFPNDLSIIEYHYFQGFPKEKNPSLVIALEDTVGNKGILIADKPIIKNGNFANFLNKVKAKLRSHKYKAMNM